MDSRVLWSDLPSDPNPSLYNAHHWGCPDSEQSHLVTGNLVPTAPGCSSKTDDFPVTYTNQSQFCSQETVRTSIAILSRKIA